MLIPGKYVPALTWDFVFFFQAVQRNHQSKKKGRTVLSTSCSNCKEWGPQNLWLVLGNFLEIGWPNASYGPMLARMLAAKKGIRRRYDYWVCAVHCFSFTTIKSSPLLLLSGSTKWRDGSGEQWARKWPITASKRQIVKWQGFSVMTGFPQETASLGFSGYIYIYICILIYDVFTNMKTEKNTQRHKGSFFWPIDPACGPPSPPT